MFQEKEDLLLKKRIQELADLCWQRDVKTYTGFLTLREQTIFHSVSKLLPPVPVVLSGGFKEAERKIVCFLPSYEDKSTPLPIQTLRVEPANLRFSQPLNHRDYLGAVMNLGIERSCIGDILIKDSGCFIFCLDKISSFLCEELRMVRHTSVICRMTDETADIAPGRVTVSGSVASPRLDSVIAMVFSLSRSQAQPYIENEHVFVDGKLTVSPGVQLKGGEIISVRGLGKFCYTGSGKETRKGRLYVYAEKYC